MTAEPREELISAYLDDELSADERAQVEKWLAESAEYRQLYEDLRAVRVSMQSLPRHKLDRDLGPAVLRRAERSVLSGAQRPAIAAAVKPTPAELARQWWARGGKRRMLWPAAAIAAALLIAMFNTQRKPAEREVAQRQVAQHAPRGETAMSAASSSRYAKNGATPETLDKIESLDETVEQAPGEAQSRTESDFDRHGIADEKASAKAATRKGVSDRRGRGVNGAAAAAPPAATDSPARKMAEGGVDKLEYLGLAEPVDLVVCDVDPEFIQGQQIEKVLTSNKVSWKRLGAEARQRDVLSRSKEEQKQAIGVQELYQVNAAPEQVRQIITELKQERSQVSNVAVSNSMVPKVASSVDRGEIGLVPKTAPATKPDASEPLFNKQRSKDLSFSPSVVTFWLRVVGGNDQGGGKK
jgi:putative zinc finger protein